MRLVLLGPPGAGKGTQAQHLCADRRLVHVSTGDLLRAAVAAGSALGIEAKGFMDKGDLVPDRLVLALLRERLASEDAQRGFLLDGFPRNASQARALEAELGNQQVECVVHMRLDDDEIVRRLLARGRKDDQEDVIRNRLKVYRDETTPLIEHYEAQGLLRTVDALGTIDAVRARINKALDGEQGETKATASDPVPETPTKDPA